MPRSTMYAIYDCCSSFNDASQQLKVVEVLLRSYLYTYKPKTIVLWLINLKPNEKSSEIK